MIEDEENEDEEEDADKDATPSSEEDGPRKRKGKRKPGRQALITDKSNGKRNLPAENDGSEDEKGDLKKVKKGQELWRPGVKTDLAPGEEMWIPLPKAREAGKTPYQDHTVHPNTMAFLGDLKQNNEREWLKGRSDARFIHYLFIFMSREWKRWQERKENGNHLISA